MARQRMARFGPLEGRRVGVALAGGSRLDDCRLMSVSAGPSGRQGVWVFTNGQDVFLPWADVTDLWEVRAG